MACTNAPGAGVAPACAAGEAWSEESLRRRAVLAFLAGILALLLTLATAPAARADGDPAGDVIRSLDVAIDVAADGTMSVTETYQWDFGTRNGLGFYRVLISGMGYGPDPGKMRVYEYSDYAVTSPSGAPAEVWVEEDTGSEIRLSVGAPDGSSDTRTGVQTYVLTYEVRGALNAIRGQADVPDQDELFWNIFTDFDNPFDQVTVTVTGPGAVTNQTCFVGARGSDVVCDSAVPSGNSVTYAEAGVPAGDAFTIVAAWAPGTFSNTDPILVDVPTSDSGGGRDPGYGGGAAGWPAQPPSPFWSFVDRNAPWLTGAFVAIAAALAGLRISRGRDQIYDGIPPGSRGMPGTRAVRMRAEPPVAVRFTPPDGIRPAQASVIMREAATNDALAATIIDLAVRGYLTIEVEGTGFFSKKPNNWRLTEVPFVPGLLRGELADYEAYLLGELFGGASSVTTKALSGKFSSEVRTFRKKLTADSDSHGWFRRAGLTWPGTSGGGRGWGAKRSMFVIWLAFLIVVMGEPIRIMFGVFAGTWPVLAPRIPWGNMAVVAALALIPLVMSWTAKAAHGRTAEGRAIYDQLRGFKQYIATADAEQLRWEAGKDIFSTYLPWAMVFGEAERWGRIFQQLVEQGRYDAVPYWYHGSDTGDVGSFTDVTDSVSAFGSTGVSSLSYSPSTSGSSGRSGFSGGGGGGAGGGGGGGGGGGR